MISNKHISFSKKNIISTLVHFNFQWYRQVMGDILFRYKIFLLFVVATMISTLANIFYLIMLPVKGFLSYPADSAAGLITTWIFYQAFSLVWIKLHQLVVTNQPWKKYILSLQISNTQKILADISILSIINIIIWIPLLFFIIDKIFRNGLLNAVFLLIAIKCVLVIELILLIQLSWINEKPWLLIPVLFINILALPSMLYLSTACQIVVILLLIVAALYLITFSPEKAYTFFRNKTLDNKQNKYRQNKHRLFPLIRIQLKTLWENSSQLNLALYILIVMDFFALAMLAHGTTNSLLTFILPTIMVLNSLTISNVFKRMNVQWYEYSHFVNSLPITKINLFIANFTIAAFLSLFFNSIILIMSFLLGDYPIYKLIPSLMISIFFLSVTYLPQIKMERYGFFVSFCLMACFSSCNYLLMTISG